MTTHLGKLLQTLQHGIFMRKISALLLTLAMIPTGFALNLEGIKGVEIVAIDGKKIKTNFFSDEETDLKPGEHQIVVRYTADFNNKRLIESKPTIFTLDIQQDTQISVNKFNSHYQAEKQMEAGLTWQITSKEKQYQVSDSDILKGEGFMPYANVERLIEEYNQQNNIALIKPEAVATTATVIATTAVITNTENSGNLQQNSLASLYQQASKAEKKAFRLWLLEQDMK
ncbi:MAG: hypothetical protein ACI9LM_005587 [Alteromonadaceae bacterium]|jgi:uncharacterized protein YccT (UPF0319 family)